MDSSADDMEAQTTEDELTALKEIVQQSLESQGVLSRIRAELRAAVFTTIDAEEKKVQQFANQKVLQFAKSKNMQMASTLFLDFLDTLNLQSTKSVFQPEIIIDNDLSRDEIAKELGIQNYSDGVPLIFSLLNSKGEGTGKLLPKSIENSESPKKSQLSSLNTSKSPNTKLNQLDNELQALIDNDKSGKVKNLAKVVGGPGSASNSYSKEIDNSNENDNNNSNKYDDDYGDDGFEDAEEIEDDISLGQVEEESLDLDQSLSLGESSGFLSMSGGGGNKGSYDKEELSMSTSIVQDSIELSVQNSRALDEYDFVEVVQKPTNSD